MKQGNRCECLDFVEASHRHRIYPVMYCRMEITGYLDMERFKAAVQTACRYVPEILCACDLRRGRFTDIGLSVEDVLIVEEDAAVLDNGLYSRRQRDGRLHWPGYPAAAGRKKSFAAYRGGFDLWDLSSGPQLRINVRRQGTQNRIAFGMSHILTDANGFLQCLYLLAALYNGQFFDFPPCNHREIAPALKQIRVQKPTQQTRKGRRKNVPPLRPLSKDRNFFCLISRISGNEFSLLHAKAQRNNATLNAVFMTAYARVIARLKNVDIVTIPCPADLRRFSNIADSLTIANMTGIYRRITVEFKPKHTFTDTLLHVQIEMELQKSRHRCFAGIKALNGVFHKVPRPLLGQIIKVADRRLPVSYTNIGRMDDQRLSFNNCCVTDCYMTGAYRLPPDFQLSISTFQNVCTLNCMLIGGAEDKIAGQYILEQIKEELLKWL